MSVRFGKEVEFDFETCGYIRLKFENMKNPPNTKRLIRKEDFYYQAEIMTNRNREGFDPTNIL